MNKHCYENDLIEALVNSEELEIFETETVINMVIYKWKTYAFASHKLGSIFHLLYIITLILYIHDTFLIEKKTSAGDGDDDDEGPPCSVTYMYVICFCLIYPVFYDGTQMVK